jgi:type VI secretion system protein ImpA
VQPDLESLLRPLNGEGPCGPDLRELADFETLRQAVAELDRAGASERVNWAREQERLLRLAQFGRDLRVWVWLCRSLIVTDGLGGLVTGLELIATGLERFWDALPPFDEDESDPRERFMGRLGALAGLGASSYQLSADELKQRRSTLHLLDELDLLVGRAEPGEATAALSGQGQAALARIEQLFRGRFGEGRDPQLGFALLSGKLALLAHKPPAKEPTAAASGLAVPRPNVASGPIAGRDDVVQTLNLVLDYYTKNEPSSPVPLLVARAKKLVTLSFLEAMKELAPGGLKELQMVAGASEDGKQPK